MLFNINHFNLGVFQSLTPLPIPSVYSKISLFGNAKFDDLWGENYIRTQQQIAQLDLYSAPSWTTTTFCLAHFDNNLQAGNIISLASPIDGWIIQRKAVGEAKFTTIAEVGALVDTYEDRLVKSQQTYTYQLIPKAGTVLGAPLESDPVSTDFRTVILLDPITQEGYSFCLNLQVDGITVNEDVVVSDTKGKYQTMLKGNRRFKSGAIGVIAVSDSTGDGINQDLAFFEQLEDFIQGDNEKIIKFPNGFTYRVQTSGLTYQKLDGVDANNNMIWAVNWAWTEVASL